MSVYRAPSNTMSPKHYAWDGPCMLCLKNVTLSEEHIIPLALSGELIVFGTCAPCNNDANKRYENIALQNDLLVPRLLLKLNRRRAKKKGEKELPMVGRPAKQFGDEVFDLRLGHASYPKVLEWVILRPPGFLTGRLDSNGGLDALSIQYIRLTMENNKEQLVTHHAHSHTAFGLSIAKMAYCFAAAELGLDAFDGEGIRALLSEQRDDLYSFVGSPARWVIPISRAELHRMSYKNVRGLLVVSVNLFASYGACPYDVVVGKDLRSKTK